MLNPGYVLANYRLNRMIGRGAGTTTWEAASLDDEGVRVAIKVLDPEAAQEPGTLKKFSVRAELMRSLRHPNIAGAIQVGATAGLAFVVMDWIDAEALSNHIRRGPLTQTLVSSVLGQAAAALDYAHNKGVIHGALTPECIFVDTSGGTKINGFTNERRPGFPIARSPCVTPELLRGEPLDLSADIYALGSIIIEALTGRRPFEGVEILRQVSEPAPGLRTINPSLDAELEMAVARALQLAPAERYATAGEMARAIRPLL